MKQLVIGMGQIGTAIQKVLECDGVDKMLNTKDYDVIHVCIPFNEGFDHAMKLFQAKYNPYIMIIHSTVAPGTSEKYGAVHSPVRGKHPDLEGGVRKFVKFFGGEKAEEAAELFRQKKVICATTPKSITTELAKLWDTEQYRECVLAEKKIYDECERLGADYKVVYTSFNKTYNEGYEKLGMPQYKKYLLEHMPGEIGGHCLNSNHDILSK